MAENKATLPENTWKCSNCGNTVVEIKPPEVCPACKQKCEFLNVTCYQPDCGSPEWITASNHPDKSYMM